MKILLTSLVFFSTYAFAQSLKLRNVRLEKMYACKTKMELTRCTAMKLISA